MWEMVLLFTFILLVGLEVLKALVRGIAALAERHNDRQLEKRRDEYIRLRVEEGVPYGKAAMALDMVPRNPRSTDTKRIRLIEQYMAEGYDFSQAKTLATYDVNKEILDEAKAKRQRR